MRKIALKLKIRKDNKLYSLPFPVVGIGASAGGLEAIKKFLKAVPEKTGMAYVFVQHLTPNHESLLTEIFKKIIAIPAVEITNEIKIHPNQIYIIPGNKMLTVKGD